MDRGELDGQIERLRDATAEIAPDAGLTDAVMAAVRAARATSGDRSRPEEDALAAIARETDAIEPDARLTGAVMERAAAEVAPFLALGARRTEARAARRSGSWLDGVVRAGPIAVGLSAALAAACFALFLSSQSSLDEAVATSFDAVEVAE